MWSDIKPAVETDYKKTTLTFSKVLTKRKEKHQTSTKVLSFVKYINYNTPTRAISDLHNHLALGPTVLMLGDYKSDIALVGVL